MVTDRFYMCYAVQSLDATLDPWSKIHILFLRAYAWNNEIFSVYWESGTMSESSVASSLCTARCMHDRSVTIPSELSLGTIEGVHEWPGQCSWYFRKSDLSKTEYRKNIFGGNSYQDSWISLCASDESSIKHHGKKKSGPCNLGDSSFSGSCRVRLDVVDLLVAQYPGTAPTRILLVGTTSTCTRSRYM